MIVNVNKVIKTFAVGAALYYCMDFFYDLEKGRMLGAMAKEDPDIKNAIELASTEKSDHLRARFKQSVVFTAARIAMREPH